ncbi:M1 family metallopeptidase [Formosa sp. S-31]|uniref:M1 family metallopeptidase n=1 Tax=Formosa sp. S-31 TaxID=2790949 RepID=UPI003EB6E5D7
MKNIFFLLCSIMLWSCGQSEKNNSSFKLEHGVSEQLAGTRGKQISDITYDLKFDIPKAKSDSIPAFETILCHLQNLESPLVLDFKEKSSSILKVEVNEEPINIVHENGHILIDEKYLSLGKNTISIAFIAGELSLNRNEDYLYTLLVPDRASTLFPCFDQPDLKAEYNLKVSAPKNWKVLAGGPLKTIETDGDFSVYSFDTSDKMSTYLFSFVAGEFNVVEDEADGFKMRLLYRETDEKKIQASVPEIFRLHREAITFLENYTGYDFPFKKLDFAAIPGFQYGGMEHVGAIQYREASVFLDDTSTENERLRRGKLIAHETAHMWFGDLVTMKWFDDVWLKEVFANFMADKIANPSFPGVNHKMQFLLEHYSSAYSVDRTKGSNPIRQQLNNLKDAGTLYGDIIYHKAPIMMRQLESLLGEETFKSGMQTYIKTFANGNADWNDLISILDAKTDLDLKTWSETWVNKSGRAIFTDEIKYDDKQLISEFIISQHAEDGSDKFWPQTFEIGLVYADAIKVVNVSVEGKQNVVSQLVGLPKPKAFIYNYNGFGYGVFPRVDDLNVILNIKDEVARGYAYINVYENVLSGNIAPVDALKLYTNTVLKEQSDAIVKLVSGELRSVFWTYLTTEERGKQIDVLEMKLRKKLLSETTEDVKKTIFGLYSGIAYNESGKAFLYRIWNKDVEIPNLKLNENDYTGIARNLVLYNHKNAKEILEIAQTKITNPDRLKRFQYLLPSLSASVEDRDAYFNGLKDEKNREKESWVLSGLYNLNHPLRQEASVKYLKESLDLLEEVQLTGDIFFPIGWVYNTIGMYNSAAAKDIVNTFLESHPDYSPVLKMKVLQAADDVFRAQKVFNTESK